MAMGAVDERAFEAFYRAHGARVRHYVFGMLQDSELARDAVQEAWTRYLYYIRRPDPRYDLPLLLTVARNVVREGWRRWHRERSLVRSRDPQAGRFEGAVELMDLVGRLPWREREVIVLHYIADLPVHVMATMLGVSITAVKSRLFRARSRLRTDYLDAEGTRHATE